MNSAFYDFVSELERIHNKKQNCEYVSIWRNPFNISKSDFDKCISRAQILD